MRKEKGNEPGADYLKKLGYEERDLNVPAVIGAVIGLFIFVGASSVVALLMYNFFVPKEPDVQAGKMSEIAAKSLPPAPHPLLQGDPVRDMVKFRKEENARLNNYGWVDKSTNTARIPVEKAIEMVAERGLPQYAGTEADLSPKSQANTPKPAPNTPEVPGRGAPAAGTPAAAPAPTGPGAPGLTGTEKMMQQPGTRPGVR